MSHQMKSNMMSSKVSTVFWRSARERKFKRCVKGLLFGIIDGTSVGDLYASREASAGIHAPPWQYLGRARGHSIVLLAVMNDIDRFILYTGQGGEIRNGNKSPTRIHKGNRGLQLSYQYNLPSNKGSSNTDWARARLQVRRSNTSRILKIRGEVGSTFVAFTLQAKHHET